MVALIGSICRLHLPQQRVHLRDRQLTIGTHRMVTGHCREIVVARIRHAVATACFCQVRQQVTQQRFHVRILQQRRQLAYDKLRRPRPVDNEPQRLEILRRLLCKVGLGLGDRDGNRNQQRLTHQSALRFSVQSR